tara:strand:+ start:2804 stop:3376 length:573 start_codon:yes stop_codon:yes gene_type:complete
MKTNRYTAGFIYPALLLTLFLVCFVFLPAVSKENDRVNYLTAIMPNMIDYITEITDLKYKGYPLPTIFIEEEKLICAGAYFEPRDTCDIAGYYDDEKNSIHIRDTPTMYMVEDRFQEVVLVHELVHFLQYHEGVYEQVECRQNLEELAYKVQDNYIDLQGIDPTQKVDGLFAIISSLCPHKHPLFFMEEQ